MADISPFQSPLAAELVRELRAETLRRMPLVDLIPLLNRHLESGRRIENSRYFYNMMNPDSSNWRAPNGEIVLAMQKVLQTFIK